MVNDCFDIIHKIPKILRCIVEHVYIVYILSVFLLSMIINCASDQQEFEEILDNTEFSVKMLIFTLNFYSQFFNS